jgi:hypothetical protein
LEMKMTSCPGLDWEHATRRLYRLRVDWEHRLRLRQFAYVLSTRYVEYVHNSTVRTLSTLCPLACQELRRRTLGMLLPLRLLLLAGEARVHNIVPIDTERKLRAIGVAFDPEPSHMKYSHR